MFMTSNITSNSLTVCLHNIRPFLQNDVININSSNGNGKAVVHTASERTASVHRRAFVTEMS